jgi:hypothetical protein
MELREVAQILRDPRAYATVLGATAAIASYDTILPQASFADNCTTTTETSPDGSIQTTQTCTSDGGETNAPDTLPDQAATPAPAEAPDPTTPPAPEAEPKKKSPKPKPKTGKKIGSVAVKLPRHISFDQCEADCGSACGLAVAGDAITDLTGYLTRPKEEILPKVKEFYHPDGGGGTEEGAFFKLADLYHLNIDKVKKDDIDTLSGLRDALGSAGEAIGEEGGVSVVEFSDSKAFSRSGKHSKFAMVVHWAMLDRFRVKNGQPEFGAVDPHKGGKDLNKDKRHNERNADGKIRWWAPKQLFASGLYKVINLTRSSKTPLNPNYR